ncbi:MAG: hypothetical protein IKP05_01620 [Alphaproteobacteria bacterium]|nr:hypothetical protein [Alphaproteobacteria bacterium]
MIIIAFSENTSKILPRILCRRFRHCAPIICNRNNLIMYQFIRHNKIEQINLRTRDIAILRAYGWRFVYIPSDIQLHTNYLLNAYSCVDLSKRTIGMKSVFIQTPNALYKYLTRK